MTILALGFEHAVLVKPTFSSSAIANFRRTDFSLEFLMGKSLDNALLNLGTKETYDESISKLGFKMEDILEEERDAGLGNGGLGRLAACYMDSLSTLDLPAVRTT